MLRRPRQVYFCAQRNRRTLVLGTPSLNGIDYLEVADADDQTVLLLTFLRDPAPLALGPAQIVIAGGESVTGIAGASASRPRPTRRTRCAIQVDRAGDFSPYALALRADETTVEPPAGVDPALSQVAFSFKAGCPVSATARPSCAARTPRRRAARHQLPRQGLSRLRAGRCSTAWRCSRRAGPNATPPISVSPWSRRWPMSPTISATGRTRWRPRPISARRAAASRCAAMRKLVDYRVDEGENARVWLHVARSCRGRRAADRNPACCRASPGVAPRIDPNTALAETMLARGRRGVRHARRRRCSQSASNRSRSTPGATRAAACRQAPPRRRSPAISTRSAAGDVLLFEEVLGPLTGAPRMRTARHRWVVRLTSVHHTDRSATR